MAFFAIRALMAAETLGCRLQPDPLDRRPDTSSVGCTQVTGGSRVTFATGMAAGFQPQFCDVKVDPETGKVTILRFVAEQDVRISEGWLVPSRA